MSTMTGPCEWPLATPDPDDPGCVSCESLDSLSPERREMIEGMAVELIWAWSGRRFGLCSTSVRPCRASCERPSTFWGPSGRQSFPPQTGGWSPALIAGEWFNIGCGTCGKTCTCEPGKLFALSLPGPVHSITEIWIGGEKLSEDAYVLRNEILFRVDGEPWPECNSEVESPRAPGSAAWEIVYKRGYEVPIGGQLAAYRLACELAMALCGDNRCALPSRISSVTRQGVSVAVLDGFENLDEGRSGIWEIDAWIASVTTQKISPPRIFSPDIPEGYLRGTSTGLAFGGRA